MATGKKKTILMYFLQKTSGTYSESSLAYLHDLLKRENIITSVESVETTAAELASFVRDGSYLKVSTKKIPEHIRAQIDFHLQKSRRSSKKSSSSNSSSAFDELLASIDSDDPKFTMDTTLGLDFSSLEELESDLKKHALDSLSPSLFSRNNGRSGGVNSRDYSRNQYNSPNASDFSDVDDVYELEKSANEHSHIGGHATHEFESANMSNSTSPISSIANRNNFANVDANINANPLNPVTYDNHIPAFPVDVTQNMPNYSSASQNSFSPNTSQLQQSMVSDFSSASQKTEQQQFFAQLQLRASLIDAKERLLSARIGSMDDPAVLRAINMLDEKLLQFTQQQSREQQKQQHLQQQVVAQQNSQFAFNSNLLSSDLQSSYVPQATALAQNPAVHAGSVKSLSSQIKTYVQELIGAQKSMHELQQVFLSTQVAQPIPQSSVSQITPAQAREVAKQEKMEVTKLRTQLSGLQEQFSQLSAQLRASSLQQQPLPSAHNHSNVHRVKNKILTSKLKPMRATAVHSHELTLPQRQLIEPAQFTADSDGVESLAPLPANISTDFETDAPTLQKMYALLAVGMRELNISPARARHIYEQLQRLYTTLSFDQKPIIYPSIVEFYASLSQQMRGVQ